MNHKFTTGRQHEKHMDSIKVAVMIYGTSKAWKCLLALAYFLELEWLLAKVHFARYRSAFAQNVPTAIRDTNWCRYQVKLQSLVLSSWFTSKRYRPPFCKQQDWNTSNLAPQGWCCPIKKMANTYIFSLRLQSMDWQMPLRLPWQTSAAALLREHSRQTNAMQMACFWININFNP